MRNLLNQIIEEIAGPIMLLDESFSNETISDKNLSNSRFYKCEFKNIIFDTIVFRPFSVTLAIPVTDKFLFSFKS